MELLLREAVCWQKGVVEGCDYRRRAEYVLQQTAAMRQRMDAVDSRHTRRRVDASLLSGHQDLTPNSDATRLRLSCAYRYGMFAIVCLVIVEVTVDAFVLWPCGDRYMTL
jgi:hypothetical protein